MGLKELFSRLFSNMFMLRIVLLLCFGVIHAASTELDDAEYEWNEPMNIIEEDEQNRKGACDVCRCSGSMLGLWVDCTGLQLTRVPVLPKSTNTLVLSRNKLTEIKLSDFEGLKKLEFLFMDYNKIQYLPAKLFNTLPNIYSFSISHNRLKSLPPGFLDSARNLEELMLVNNDLKSLPKNLFKKIRFGWLKLDHNPLECSCS